MSGVTFCNAGSPIVPGLMRTPSTSTSVWLLSAPRMNTEVGWPGPPVARHVEPRVEAEQVGRVVGGAALDRLAVDHDRPARALPERHRAHASRSRRPWATSGSSSACAAATDAASANSATALAKSDGTIDERDGMHAVGHTPSTRPRRTPVIRQLRWAWGGGNGRRAGTASPEVLPLAHREAGLVRKAGLRALERAHGPCLHPLPAPSAQWVPSLVARAMQASLDYRCGGSAGIGPASRSP